MDDKCPKCHGTGVINNIVDGSEVIVPCSCFIEKKKELQLQQVYDQSHFPKGKIREFTYEDYLKLPLPPEAKKYNEMALSKYKEMLDNIDILINGPNVIWIWGDEPNACHTTLAVILGKSAVAKNYKVYFLSMQELVNILFSFETMQEKIQRLVSNDIIIIDDAFDLSRCIINQKTSKFIIAHLFSVINELLSNNKHIICTSNCAIYSIDPVFQEIKVILLRSYITLHIQGSITTYLQRIHANG
jgi:hypothetical protein